LPKDLSNGYDALAADYIAARRPYGRDIIRGWTASLPTGGHVLDLGAGYGEPVTPILLAAGLKIWALDSAPAMIAAYKQRFPAIKTACEAVETSAFFNKKFDGILAIGLMFLLPSNHQTQLIARMSDALHSGGQLIFTAPRETGQWKDLLTGQLSRSLGEAAYHQALKTAGLVITGSHLDEGGSHYYSAEKP